MLLSSPDGGPTVLRVEVPCTASRAPAPVIRVVLAEDGVLLREGLAGLLERFGFQAVAIVGDAGGAPGRGRRARPRPGASPTSGCRPAFTDEGLRAAVELRRARPGLAGGRAQPVRPAQLRRRPARLRRRPGRRLPAQGPGGGRRRVHRRAAPGGRRRHRRRPAGHPPAGAAPPRPADRAVGRGSARCSRSSPRATPTPRSRGALVVSEAAVGKHVGNIFAKLRLPQTDDTNRRVLAVLAYLRGGSTPRDSQ